MRRRQLYARVRARARRVPCARAAPSPSSTAAMLVPPLLSAPLLLSHCVWCRSQMNQDSHTSILHLEGVKDTAASQYYMGKRVCYIYKAATVRGSDDASCNLEPIPLLFYASSFNPSFLPSLPLLPLQLKSGTRFRSIWGRISRPHGTNGAVRAKFNVNLPSKSLGGPVRVMLYPQTA